MVALSLHPERSRGLIPTWVGHRGYPARYPENTLCGLDAGYAAGGRYFEVDVRATRDGEVILMHDGTLERVCGDPRRVRDIGAFDLIGLSAYEPARFGRRYLGEPVARLADLRAWMERHPRAELWVEIKADEGEPNPVDLGRRVREWLVSVARRVVLISLDPAPLYHASGYRIGAVIEQWDDRARFRTLQPDYLIARAGGLPVRSRPRFRASRIAAYEVETRSRARSLLRRGVYVLETNAIGDRRGGGLRGVEPLTRGFVAPRAMRPRGWESGV